jgi:hypothetical protein
LKVRNYSEISVKRFRIPKSRLNVSTLAENEKMDADFHRLRDFRMNTVTSLPWRM